MYHIMKIYQKILFLRLQVITVLFVTVQLSAMEFTVTSPNQQIMVTVTFHENDGTLFYDVSSSGIALLDSSSLGITTNIGDFTSEMTVISKDTIVVDETYRLPVGKCSTYVNHANEMILTLGKDQKEVQVRFRAYDEGIAFSYAIPGSGNIQITKENSTFWLPREGEIYYWGMEHPNNYGYETQLGRIYGNRFSMPVLARLIEQKHFLFIAQAASYGTYIIPNFIREGSKLILSFPMDQVTPVTTSLPFQSPWRFVIISPTDLKTIVESTMPENLNPATEPELAGASWIKPGRSCWDYIAGDRDKPGLWIDFNVQMGWEYYIADAGFENRWDVNYVTDYATQQGVGMLGWGYTPDMSTRDKAETHLQQFVDWGLVGAKLDFFDHNPFTGEDRTNDFEDTQASLKMRDYLAEIAAEKHLLLEFHGSTMPSGERRRWPHIMTVESVAGMEKRNQNVVHDLIIPYVRNIMGPMSYTGVKFDRSAGTPAYQMGQTVIYEAGIQIFAERHDIILAFKGVEFFKKVPSAWDETQLIEGYPGTYTIMARRKKADWFIGGITNSTRTSQIPLTFLVEGTSYDLDIYKDSTDSEIAIEHLIVTSEDELEIRMLRTGGFAAYLHPPIPPEGFQEETDVLNVFPNPFHQMTTFAFPVGDTSKMTIEIYNLRGECIQSIQNVPAASRYTFDGSGLASGIYLVQMTTGSKTIQGKMMILH